MNETSRHEGGSPHAPLIVQLVLAALGRLTQLCEAVEDGELAPAPQQTSLSTRDQQFSTTKGRRVVAVRRRMRARPCRYPSPRAHRSTHRFVPSSVPGDLHALIVRSRHSPATLPRKMRRSS